MVFIILYTTILALILIKSFEEPPSVLGRIHPCGYRGWGQQIKLDPNEVPKIEEPDDITPEEFEELKRQEDEAQEQQLPAAEDPVADPNLLLSEVDN